MNVELIAITKPVKDELANFSPEEFIVYVARVSSPANQLNTETAPKLLKYCINHGHWSIFQQVDLTFEIETSRAIAAQILRHSSADFQEFSQRYAEVSSFQDVELRVQGKTKQGGEDVIDDVNCFLAVKDLIERAEALYKTLLSRGASRETARFILPLCTTTRLYMKNSVRGILAWMNQRLHKDTQKEHRLIAEAVKDIFIQHFPVISSCFDNFSNAYTHKFM